MGDKPIVFAVTMSSESPFKIRIKDAFTFLKAGIFTIFKKEFNINFVDPDFSIREDERKLNET